MSLKSMWHGFCLRTRAMNQRHNITMLKGLASSDGGSVLMEYIIVQVLVACFLMLIMNLYFYNVSTSQFGPGGVAVKYFYQRLLGGLSLPVP